MHSDLEAPAERTPTSDPAATPDSEAVAGGGRESFGTWLRRQRRMRDISLREIADTSKISLRYLEALERDRFDILPAEVFAKGFLRQYARYVGLDAEEVVNFFLAAQGEVDDGAQDAPPPPPPISSHRVFLGAAVLVALLLLLIVGILNRLNRQAPDLQAPAMSAVAPGPSPSTAAPEETDPAAEPASDPVSSAAPEAAIESRWPLRVTVDFLGDCWVEALVDGERRLAEIRIQGQALVLEARELVELKLGDPSVVAVEVNRIPLPLDATAGRTLRLRIDLGVARALADGRAVEVSVPPASAAEPGASPGGA